MFDPADYTQCIAAWKFDDGTGTSAADASGNGFTATLNGSPPWVAGEIGKAISCNAVNQYADLGTGFPALTSFSFALWWQVGTIPAWAGPLQLRQTGIAGFQFVNNTSSTSAFVPNIVIWDGTTETAHYCASTYSIAASQSDFVHFCGTWDGTTLAFYADGAAQTMTSAGVGGYGPSGCYVARSGTGSSLSMVGGSYDEVRIYSSALSSTDVATLAAWAGSGGGGGGLLSRRRRMAAMSRREERQWNKDGALWVPELKGAA